MTILYWYLAAINGLALMLFGADKYRARKGLWRVPEKTLFLLAALGGSAGAIAGMYLFHHKTKHWYFVFGMPLILAGQLILAALLYRLFRRG